MRKVLVSFMASMCVCSCQNTDDGTSISQNLIRLKAEIIPTSRVTDLNLQSTKIVEEQLVGITIDNAQTAHENVAWEVDSKGNLGCTGTEVSWGAGEITVFAYHPYRSSMNTNSSFSVSEDQSTDDGYLNSDLLWAKATAVKSDIPVELSFTHMLSKLNIKLQTTGSEDLSGAVISVCETNVTTNFNTRTGELISPTEMNVKDIKASVTTSTALQASCIIIPQTIANGTIFIKIEHSGTVYQYKLSDTIDFEGGKVYTFTLSINKDNPGDVGAIVPDMPWG